MANLLRHYIFESHGHINVHYVCWARTDPVDPWYEFMNRECGLSFQNANGWVTMRNTLLIIDEVQASFNDLALWADLIKPMSERERTIGPMMVLFGSYESPLPTPMTFALDQSVFLQPNSQPSSTFQQGSSIIPPRIGLFFSLEEYKDVVMRFQMSTNTGGTPFAMSTELSERIWDLTCGHPGGVRALLEILAYAPESRPYRKCQKQIPLHAVLPVLDDSPRLFDALHYLPFNRSLPSRGVIMKNDPALAAFLEDMLSSDGYEGNIRSNEQLNFCHEEGWVHAEALTRRDPEFGPTCETLTYVFSTKLHRQKLAYMLLQPDFPSKKFHSVEDLSFAALRDFKRTACLLSSEANLGPGELGNYFYEFYRSCFYILGRKNYLVPEFSIPGCERSITYFIEAPKWGIELVREGDRLQEHIERFLPGGCYYPWIERGEMDQYLLIDFRTSSPPILEGNVPFLYFAVFDPNFHSCSILSSNGVEKPRFALLG